MLEIVNEIIELIQDNAVQVGEERWMTKEEVLPELKELWSQIKDEDVEIAWWMINQRLPGLEG